MISPHEGGPSKNQVKPMIPELFGESQRHPLSKNVDPDAIGTVFKVVHNAYVAVVNVIVFHRDSYLNVSEIVFHWLRFFQENVEATQGCKPLSPPPS